MRLFITKYLSRWTLKQRRLLVALELEVYKDASPDDVSTLASQGVLVSGMIVIKD